MAYRSMLSPRAVAACAVLITPFALTSCSSDAKTAAPSGAPSPAAAAGACPIDPVSVLVSVDQWGDIVSELGGDCARVETLLASSSVDPHDYEPSPADAVAFQGAQLIVVNGGHYDEWATKLAAGSAPNATLISAVDDARVNPHAWYDPKTVDTVADAVTAGLTKLAPGAGDYFAERRTAFGAELKPYDAAIAAIKAGSAGKAPGGMTYAATEGVFDDMATAVGLQNRTPPGYQTAAQNETDPSPADLDAFLTLLHDKGVDVLIFNTQTEGSVPAQLRNAAEAAGIPVVEVTETVAPGANSFEAWQVEQLTALAKALGVSPG